MAHAGNREEDRAVIHLLTSDIGRGHPFYLDGLAEALTRQQGAGTNLLHRSVFEIARGLSLWAWRGVRISYVLAGRASVGARIYTRARARAGYSSGGFLTRLLGRDLRPWAEPAEAVVVDHPVLVAALGDRRRTWYLHGELVVPNEAIVHHAATVFVPTEEAARDYARTGFPRARIVVTGLCVERGLAAAAESAWAARRERLGANGPLTLGFFSSGAEPTDHVKTLATAVTAAARGGHRCLVFAAAGGRLERAVRAQSGASATNALEIIGFTGRADLDIQTAARFAELDVVVAPPHERSNWALALGVPFVLVGPDLGPFAPLNRALLLRNGVAVELHDPEAARRVDVMLESLRHDGALRAMGERGWGRPRDGFDQAAARLLASVER